MCSTKQRLSALLREQRTSLGFSLRRTAEAAGLAPSTLSRWEAGFCLPRVPELEALLDALNVAQEDVIRILASLDAPRAARALRDQQIDSKVAFAAPSGGALLRALRSKARLSLSDIADSLGVNVSTVSRWEACATHPSPEQFEGLLKILGASGEARECLIASGIAKLKTKRPAYDETSLAAQLDKLEVVVSNSGEDREVRLLQLQSMLWWFRDKPGAEALLQRSILAYAQLLLRESRFKEAIQQAQTLLESGIDPYSSVGIQATRIMARADVYRWSSARPHLGLFLLEKPLSVCGEAKELVGLLTDMVEYSRLAGRESDAEDYEKRISRLNGSADQKVRTNRLLRPRFAAGSISHAGLA